MTLRSSVLEVKKEITTITAHNFKEVKVLYNNNILKMMYLNRFLDPNSHQFLRLLITLKY